jgi:hypothetical protein
MDSDHLRNDLLLELSDMLRKPADIEVFRQVVVELEFRLTANDLLLWNLRYRVAHSERKKTTLITPSAALSG